MVSIILDDLDQKVMNLYDSKKEDVNLFLGKDTGLVHHHFGLGFVGEKDYSQLNQERIRELLHYLETNQVNYLLDVLGEVKESDVVLDGGSGRGGTAILLNRRWHCGVVGITISQYQQQFSQELVKKLGVADKLSFDLMNMKKMVYTDDSFDHIVTNETTMHVSDLNELFPEFARAIKPRGKYVLATWLAKDSAVGDELLNKIDKHYQVKVHSQSDYLTALAKNNFKIYKDLDLSQEAVPYWRIRSLWEKKTGIEEVFLQAYSREILEYHIIGTQYLP